MDEIDKSLGDLPTVADNDLLDVSQSLGDLPTAGDEEGVLVKLDRYEVLRQLGRGAFGAVFLAQDTVADTYVAIKTLPPELNHSPDDLQGVKDNYKMVSRLSHPNIAQLKYLHKVNDVSDDDGGIHISTGEYLVVMEYVEGSTLSSWRRQFPDKKVPYKQAVKICFQVSKALDYAHSQKIIHRDIKPGNIMIDIEGNAKVLDFGLAAEVRSSMSRLSTEKGSTSGTRPYMSPEQLLGQGQDARADQYALAVMLYELVSGAVPFQSVFESGDMQLILAVVPSQTVPELSDISKRQNQVLAKAMAKKKSSRFESCQDFLLGLESTPQTSKGLLGRLIPACAIIAASIFTFLYINKEEVPKTSTVQPIREIVESPVITDTKIKAEVDISENDKIDKEEKLQEKLKQNNLVTQLLAEARASLKDKKINDAEASLSSALKIDPQNILVQAFQQEVKEEKQKLIISNLRVKLAPIEKVFESIAKTDLFEDEIKKVKDSGLQAQQSIKSGEYASGILELKAYLSSLEKIIGEDSSRIQFHKDSQTLQSLKSESAKALKVAYPDDYAKFAQKEKNLLTLMTPVQFSEAVIKQKELISNLQSYETKLAKYNKYIMQLNATRKDAGTVPLNAQKIFHTQWKDVQKTYNEAGLKATQKDYKEATVKLAEASREYIKISSLFTELEKKRKTAEQACTACRVTKTEKFYNNYAPKIWAQFKTLKDEAEKAYSQSKYQEAHVGWVNANVLIPDLEREADKNYKVFLLKNAATDSDKWKLSLSRLEENPKDILALEIQKELMPKFKITTAPAGANIYINDRLAGTSPLLFPVTYGKLYSIKVSKEKFWDKKIIVKSDFFRTKNLPLEFTAKDKGYPPITHLYEGSLQAQNLQKNVAKSKNLTIPVKDMNVIFRLIPAGEFKMGSPYKEKDRREDEATRKVKISNHMWVAQHEVDQADFSKIMNLNPSKAKGPNRPVENVSWQEAKKFCEKLNGYLDNLKLLPDGYEVRLLTEAEWEYSCRSGTIEMFAGKPQELGWYAENANYRVHNTGTKHPNAWGLYDMHGNVSEWCHDFYESYGDKDVTNPFGDGDENIYRGGSFSKALSASRSAYRRAEKPSRRSPDRGFRICIGPEL